MQKDQNFADGQWAPLKWCFRKILVTKDEYYFSVLQSIFVEFFIFLRHAKYFCQKHIFFGVCRKIEKGLKSQRYDKKKTFFRFGISKVIYKTKYTDFSIEQLNILCIYRPFEGIKTNSTATNFIYGHKFFRNQ